MNDIPPIFKRKTYEGFMTQDLSRLRNNLQVSTKRSCSTILIKFFLLQKITQNQKRFDQVFFIKRLHQTKKDLLQKIWSSFFFFKGLHQTNSQVEAVDLDKTGTQNSHVRYEIIKVHTTHPRSLVSTPSIMGQFWLFPLNFNLFHHHRHPGKLREQVPYRRGERRDLRCGAAEAAWGQIWEIPGWDRACHHSSGDDDDDDIDDDDDKGDHDDGDELKIPHHLKIVCQVGILEVGNI